MYSFSSILFILCTLSLFAQDNNSCNEITNRKAVKLYNEALNNIRHTGFANEEAYGLLINAIKTEPEYTDAYYVLGDINYQRINKSEYNQYDYKSSANYYKNFIKYFSKVIEFCPQYKDYVTYYYLGEFYYKNQTYKDYKKSKEYLEIFTKKSVVNDNKSKAEEMIKHIDAYFDLINHPVPFNPVKVEGLDTLADEYLPLLSPDEEYLFYTHRYLKKNEYKKLQVEEFTFSEKVNKDDTSKEIFTSGEGMPNPFNQQGYSQGAASITIDNNHLYITLCEKIKTLEGNSYINCDIYSSDRVNNEWQKLKNLGPNINGRYTWEGQPSISSDGKTLYFASARPQINDTSRKDIDIYYSVKDDKGNWLPAKNIGPIINTTGNDKSPFIHSDSQTLYFSSDGRYGMGGYDIYYSKNVDGKWTEPKNIGYPINDENDNVGFIVSTNGKKAYFSSNNIDSANSHYNIYSFDLYKEARPQKVLFTKGQLVDDKGEALTNAKVVAKSTLTSKTTEGLVDSISGKYALAVSVVKNEDILLTVKKDSFAFASQYIKQDDETVEKPVQRNFEVAPLEVGKTVKINNIQFETNEAVFDKESKVVLDNFADFLRENPNVKIEIHGHTDNVGSDASNQILSEKRAKSVRDYLLFIGIDSKRIIAYKGFGAKKPIATNDTPEGRALNRRTEFVIVGK